MSRGIAGDVHFVDALFNYQELVRTIRENRTDHEEKITKLSVVNYAGIINYCARKCYANRPGKIEPETGDYSNWIRWNQPEIEAELTFLRERCSEYDAESAKILQKCGQILEQTEKVHFRLSDKKRIVADEYRQSILVAKKFKMKNIIFQTGKLYVNYVNSLIKKYYFAALDRPDENFEDLAEESELIRKLLEENRDENSRELSTEIEKMTEIYEAMRNTDAKLKNEQRENVRLALRLARSKDRKTLCGILAERTNGTFEKMAGNPSDNDNPNENSNLNDRVVIGEFSNFENFYEFYRRSPLTTIGVSVSGFVVYAVSNSNSSAKLAPSDSSDEILPSIVITEATPTDKGGPFFDDPNAQSKAERVAQFAHLLNEFEILLEEAESTVRGYEEKVQYLERETERKIASKFRFAEPSELENLKTILETKSRDLGKSISSLGPEIAETERELVNKEDVFVELNGTMEGFRTEIDKLIKTVREISDPSENVLESLPILKILFVTIAIGLLVRYGWSFIQSG